MRTLARVIRVLHLIHRFYVGGAERQFIERLRAHPQGFEPVVGCLEISGGNLADFRALGLGEPRLFPIRRSLLLCGLFPIAWRRGRAQLWKHRSCYLSTPLLRAGFAQPALRCFFDHLDRRAGLVRLEDVPGEGPFHLHLVDELNRRGWPSLVSSWYTRALFRPAASGDDFLERALNGKRRKELRRQRARLAEQGRLELCELSPGEDPAPWIPSTGRSSIGASTASRRTPATWSRRCSGGKGSSSSPRPAR